MRGLPHELTPTERLDPVRGFVLAASVSEGMVADVAIHAPCRRGADERNHHAPILLTLRPFTGESFGPKARAWNDPARLELWRTSWAAHLNRALEQSGETARVDHRSLAAQGIEREPQVHLGTTIVKRAARRLLCRSYGRMGRSYEKCPLKGVQQQFGAEVGRH